MNATTDKEKYLEKISSETDVYVSIVIPVFNEEDNIGPLYQGLKQVLNTIDGCYEIIFVDDGSSDGTAQRLEEIVQGDEQVIAISFRRNFGQTAAMSAGFDYARGKVFVTMDGDLQNDPKDIPRLLAKLEEGYDVVSGWRAKRKDKLLSRRFPSILANRLIGWVTGVKLHDYGCSLKAYRSEIAKDIRLYGEMHRFLPALAVWVGGKVCEVKVDHHERKFGRSKYGLTRTVRVILDLLTVKFFLSFFTRPIQIFGLSGLVMGSAGFGIAAYLTYVKFIQHAAIAGRPLLLLAILLLLLGIQMISIGLLGEVMVRTYHESRNLPIYAVREVIRSGEEVL